MKRATIIIGANYGDEGKGLLVDSHASLVGEGAIVVRFSGGANAGHTVVTPDGVHHVFSHFGAGTLAGAATFLSRYFIANPFLWQKEALELHAKGVSPRVFIDRRALLTTPYDMMLNQFAEMARGSSRHGSCGVGINETVQRCVDGHFVTQARMLSKMLPDFGSLRHALEEIRTRYVPRRIIELGIEVSAEMVEMINNDAIIDNFLSAAASMRRHITISDEGILEQSDQVIFEGSQGLLLDEINGYFPHVTRARTGLTNAMNIINLVGAEEVNAIYVTRAYMTRHGAGPFPSEVDGMAYPDPTNVDNAWQGSLRFGSIDLGALSRAIEVDFAPFSGAVRKQLAVTCIDQVEASPVPYVSLIGEKRVATTSRFLLREIAAAVGVDQVYQSRGRTRSTLSDACIKTERVFA